ncbi:MAG: signal peptide peptidase SppA, partial [Pedobacter sp.]
FVSRVADGRKKTTAYVDGIGGGRVWTGADAVKIGLADRVGDFNSAIRSAARKAGLEEYRIVEFPEKIDPFKAFLSDAKDNISVYYTKKELGESYPLYKKLKEVTTMSGIQARMLYEPTIK